MLGMSRAQIWGGILFATLVVVLVETKTPFVEDTLPYFAHTASAALAVSDFVPPPPLPPQPPPPNYLEVRESCGPYYDGECLNVRTGPGMEYSVAFAVREGAVLHFSAVEERAGRRWLKVAFDEWIRYPDRLPRNLYIAEEFVHTFYHEGPREIALGQATTSKYILVDVSDQMLYAYEGAALFMAEHISTGIELTPTPRGTFSVFRKTPSRYMQGPLPGISEKYYDLPGVPWNLYFTPQGAVIHGAYWHDKFGQQWSNGCVNMPPKRAKELYEWADLGTVVIVRD